MDHQIQNELDDDQGLNNFHAADQQDNQNQIDDDLLDAHNGVDINEDNNNNQNNNDGVQAGPLLGNRLERFILPIGPTQAHEELTGLLDAIEDPNVGTLLRHLLQDQRLMGEQMSGIRKVHSGVAGSLVEGYEFTDEVKAQLRCHPRDHSHVADSDFIEMLRCIPQEELQPITTTCDPTLVSKLSGVDRVKITEVLPRQERLWSSQLRIAAYLYDIMLRLKESQDYNELVEQFPLIGEALQMAKFNFYSVTTARQKIASEKLRSLAAGAGDQYRQLFRADDKKKRDAQHPSLVDDKVTEEMQKAAKRHKAMVTLTTTNDQAKPVRVFVTGSERGLSAPRHNTNGQHHQQQTTSGRQQNSTSRVVNKPDNQQQNARGWLAGRATKRGNYRGRARGSTFRGRGRQ